MTMTPKENFLNYLTGKPFEWFPNAMEDMNSVMFMTGIDERSPNNTGGKDWYGCEWTYDSVNDACVIDTNKPYRLSGIENWREELVFPDLDTTDWSACAKADGVDSFDPDKLTYFMIQEGLFERLHSLLSFEDALYALMEDPEEVASLFDEIMKVKLKTIDILIDYWHADVINMHDDWGSQLNMFFSPEIWRDLFKPQLKKAVDHCHARGVPFELHSCGKIEKILPECAEVGVDGVQIMGINDVAAVKRIIGDSMSFAVSVDYQRMAALDAAGNLTEAEVRRLVREEVERYAPGGRYYGFAVPVPSWYLPIENDELAKLSSEVCGAA